MNLHRTRQLIQDGIDCAQPIDSLVHVLESAIELVSLDENEFCWSSWENAEAAKVKIEEIIRLLESGSVPERLAVSILFAPTGPLQDVSISSGRGEPFLKLAEKFDEIEKLIWHPRG